MLAELHFNFNNEFVKYLVIAVTTPLWLPFLKALWEDFNDALREEGGLLGYAPPPSKLEALNSEKGRYESVLVSEPWHRYGDASQAPEPAAPRGPGSRRAGSGFGRAAAGAPRRSAAARRPAPGSLRNTRASRRGF